MYIEDSLLPLDNTKGNVGPDQLGCIVDGDNIDPRANPNDCKNLVAKNFAIQKPDIKAIQAMYGEFLSLVKPPNDVFTTPGGKNVIDLTE